MKSLKLFLIASLTICSIPLFAQDEDLALERQVNITILYPGVSAEFPLSDNFSVVPKAGLAFAFSATASTGSQAELFYLIAPAYNLQGRYYYDGLKRESKKGKALFRNSGNYAFAQFGGNLNALATSAQSSDVAAFSLGAGWGLQRVYGNNAIVSWGIGLGYFSTQQISFIGEFTLGINLSSL